jgi:uncharacterized membrane protein YdbT with pleckstrin-like domain
MSYIEKSLGAGERIVALARFHWLYVLIAVLALILLGIVLVGIAIFAVMMIRYHTTEIGVTTHRFIMKTGWIRRDTQEIALDNIEGVQVHQSIWGRIFGYGRLVVQGTGVDAVHLPSMLADPVGFRRAIESARGDRSPPH